MLLGHETLLIFNTGLDRRYRPNANGALVVIDDFGRRWKKSALHACS